MLTSTNAPMQLYEQSLKHGNVFRLALPQWAPFIICMDAATTKDILMDKHSDKPDVYKVLEVPRGCPILITKKTMSSGPTGWPSERKALAPCFAKSNYDMANLEKHLAKLNAHLEVLVLEKTGVGVLVDAPRLMCQFTIDAFASSAFGVALESMGGPLSSLGNTFLDEVRIAHVELILNQAVAPWRRWRVWDPEVRRGNVAASRCLDVGKQVINSGRQRRKEHPEHEVGGVMKVLLDFPGFTSEVQRAGEVVSFLTGGYDTTGYTLSWVLFELARHPQEQSALADELRAQDCGEHLPPRLDRVIKEAMRLWPVTAGGGTRIASRDFATSSGLIIAKGSHVSVSMYGAFRQQWVKDANEFLPDRWREDAPQVTELHEFIIPFNKGRRNCIGQTHALMTIKATIAYLVRKYEWSISAPGPKPVYFLTLKPEGLDLGVKKRAL